jgi:hypothetical protein
MTTSIIVGYKSTFAESLVRNCVMCNDIAQAEYPQAVLLQTLQLGYIILDVTNSFSVSK